MKKNSEISLEDTLEFLHTTSSSNYNPIKDYAIINIITERLPSQLDSFDENQLSSLLKCFSQL